MYLKTPTIRSRVILTQVDIIIKTYLLLVPSMIKEKGRDSPRHGPLRLVVHIMMTVCYYPSHVSFLFYHLSFLHQSG